MSLPLKHCCSCIHTERGIMKVYLVFQHTIGPPGLALPSLGSSPSLAATSAPGVVVPQLGAVVTPIIPTVAPTVVYPASVSSPGVMSTPQLSTTPTSTAQTIRKYRKNNLCTCMPFDIRLCLALLTPVISEPGGIQELTEAQKKLVEEEPTQTLDAQENMKISGSNARHMVMQKLMRPSEVCIYVCTFM